MLWHEFEQPVKSVMDIAALGTFIATVAQWLPSVAALFTVIWGALRCYDAYLDIQTKRTKLAQARNALGTLKDAKEKNDDQG